jgi:signal transduction histidine kinase
MVTVPLQPDASPDDTLEVIGKMLARLVRSSSLERGEIEPAMKRLTEFATAALRVERASVWRFTEDRRALVCLDLYEASHDRHTNGQVLAATTTPSYFAALQDERTIAANNAHLDARTREFEIDYLVPNGIGAMLDSPIWLAGRLVGVMCHEHLGVTRPWAPWEQLVSGTFADVASMILGSAERAVQARSLAEYGSKLETLVNERTQRLHEEQRLREAERTQLLERERAARQEAEAASRAKDEFLAMLGHELRNPLAPIRTALDVMRSLGEVAAYERAVIERQVSHLKRLVDDMLDVSRITKGKLELRCQPVELFEVITKGVELASPLIEKRGHFLSVDAPSRGLLTLADADRLAQVVSNLLSNAAKFTPQGGRISIRAHAVGEHVAMTVRDSGIGIPANLLPAMFDAFVQGVRELDQSQGGLGLGLAIVRGIVSAHGGEITVHSDGPGCGSAFEVRLTRIEGAPHVEPPAVAVTTSPSFGRGRRIMIVDDNEDAARMIALALEMQGFETTVAFDGPTAVAVASEFQPQAALLDLGLPVMDGFEVASRLRSLPGLSDVCLIAVTGYGRPDDRERTRLAGFDQHVVKPLDMLSFDRMLANLLDPHS